jgi:Tfp pilus assembly protein PilO
MFDKSKGKKTEKKPMALREKVLVGILIISCVIGGYLMLRVKDQTTQRAVWKEMLEESRQDVRKTKIKRAGNKDIKRLNKELAGLTEKTIIEEEAVAGIESGFIDLNSKKAIAKMRSQLTSLAKSHELRMASVTQADQDLSGFTDGRQPQLMKFLERPAFDIMLYGKYHDFLVFVERLETLENRVVVTKVSVTPRPEGDGLNIKLIMSF